MKQNDKRIRYLISKYGLENSTLCKQCGSEVIKSPRKHYNYYCFKCNQLLFNDETQVSAEYKQDKDHLKQIMEKYGTKI